MKALFSKIRPQSGSTRAKRTDAPPPKLILHAGSQKTGTTSIQYVMSENRPYLDNVRVWYPPIYKYFPVKKNLQRARAHFAFANAVSSYTDDDRARIDAFLGAMKKNADRYDRVVLSAETLYRLFASDDGAVGESALDRRLRFLDRLAKLTADFQPEVLLYLRRADRFAASLYAEATVRRSTSQTFEEFLRAKGGRFNYRERIDQFQRFFPTRVYGFEETAKAGLIDAFCSHAGIPGPLPDTPERPRPSVPNAAVLWLTRAKGERSGMTPVERTHRWHFALLPENAEMFEKDRKTVFWTDRAARDAFIEANHAGVTEVSFPPVPDTIEPPASWSDSQHADAEKRFFAWQKANKAMLLKRRAKRIPPFVLDA